MLRLALRNHGRPAPTRPRRARSLAAGVASQLALVGSLAFTAPPANAANLVTNPGFESSTTGWNAPVSSLSRVAGRGGGSAARLSAPRAGVGVLNDTPNTVDDATAGAAYTVAAWVRTSTAPLTAELRIREVVQDGSVKTSAKSLTLSDTGWHSITLSHAVARSGSTLDLNVLVPTMRSGSSLDVDDVSVVATTTTAPAPPACSVNSKLVPSCGALWGIYNPIGSISGATNWTTAITSMESKVGRRFDLVKRYHDFSNTGSSGAFPDSHERTLASGGRIPFLSWVSTNYSTGADFRWADIAAGRYDASVIDPVARRLKTYGGKVFLDFDHEMDGRIRVNDGTPADYVRAYRHIRERFNAIGAGNVIFVWTTTGYLGNEAKIKASYPGDAYVDWIAYDPYNFFVCHDTPWKDFGTTVDTFYDWLMANGHSDKPFMLGEYGSAPDPRDPYRRAGWFRGQVAGMKAHPNIKAVMYYNSHGSCSASTSSSISNDAPALDAFGDAGRDPYFRVSH
jgi:hypothetical protein